MQEPQKNISPRRNDRLELSMELDPYWNKEKRSYVKKDSLPKVAVSGEYEDLKGKPAIDSEPTEDSSNLVSSGGVFSALKKKADLVDGTVPAAELPKASSDGSVAGIVNLRRHNGENYSGLAVVGEGLWVNCKNGGGLSITGSGELIAAIRSSASDDEITNRTSTTAAITPANLDKALETTVSKTTNTITSAGVVTDYLLNTHLVGGIRLRYSSTSLDNYTAYAYNGVAVRRTSSTDDYLYDTSDKGIVRFKDLSAIKNALSIINTGE